MLAGVQIQHELAERTFQSRQTGTQHDEAGTREFRSGGEVHQAQRLAQLEMLLRLKTEIAGLSVLLHDHIRRLIRAVRHTGIENVR
jgi:hypothetical protein